MADMACETVHQANLMIKKLIPESKQDQALKLSLLQTIQAVEMVIKQTTLVNAGRKPESRVVSIVTGYSVHKGNPSDKTLLVDAIEHHKKIFEKAPREIAVDRGYYSNANEDELSTLAVKHISMPNPGKKTKVRQTLESTNKFKKLQKFRAGVEGRISCLKRSFGIRSSYLRGHKVT